MADSAVFPNRDLSLAHTQWLSLLNSRMAELAAAELYALNDMEYGGAATSARDLAPLEEKVDEARRMVCVLGGEVTRRSEGDLAVWGKGPYKNRKGSIEVASGMGSVEMSMRTRSAMAHSAMTGSALA